jgi:hypothetical protein
MYLGNRHFINLSDILSDEVNFNILRYSILCYIKSNSIPNIHNLFVYRTQESDGLDSMSLMLRTSETKSGNRKENV